MESAVPDKTPLSPTIEIFIIDENALAVPTS